MSLLLQYSDNLSLYTDQGPDNKLNKVVIKLKFILLSSLLNREEVDELNYAILSY